MRSPPRIPLTLSVLVALSVAVLLFAMNAGQRALVLVSKPLASLCFIGVAVALGAGRSRAYGRLVLFGLVLGAAGDVALMFPSGTAFLAGLAVFLLGHVCYIAACATLARPARWLRPELLPVAAASAAIFWWLAPSLGPMRVPVLLYVVTITAMVGGALAVLRSTSSPGRWLLLAGALLFYLSDITVALNRFVEPRFLHSALGLPAYYLGQVLIAWSTGSLRR